MSCPTVIKVITPGPPGPAGPTGPAGVGAAWRQGAGAPGGDTGSLGDFYLNTTNGDIYGPKTSSGWGSVIFNIAQGQAGPAGPTGQSGREVQLQVGATHIQWRYVGDPAWADLVALSVITGPTGPAGPTGATGPQGLAGAEGPSGVANATAPITYDVGTKTIAIAAATTAAAGSMSAADKAKLDGLAAVATSGAYADLSGRPTLGTAAALNTGTSAGSVVALDGSGRLPAVDGSQLTGLPLGGVTSIGLTAPTGFSVSGSPITTNGSITLAFATGYSLPTDAKQANWDTAHAERLRWDGGATGLDATTARTSLGLGTAATTDATAYATAAQGALAATAIQPSDSRLTDAREWSAGTITQAEAEAGTGTTRLAFTAARVFQAIAAWWAASGAASKLAGIASGATANQTDAFLLSRANHTGTQTAGTITGLANVAISGAYSDLSGQPDLSLKADLIGGLVPSAQLPSYVDDVLEFANLAAFPGAGEAGKIYVTLDGNRTYRWSGSSYVEISASPGSTDAVVEGATNLYFTNARARGAISASGSLSYNASTGVLSYTAPTPFDPASPGAIGGTTPAAGSFTSLSASTRLGLPSSAPASPAAGDIYRSADTLRYRDSGGTERLLLNAADNLANLASAATARTNLGLTGLATATVGAGLSLSGGTLSSTATGTKTLARFTARDNQPPAANFATLDTRNSISVLEFDAATEEYAAFIGVIPEGANLTSGLLVRIWWMGDTATSGNVRWGAAFEASGTDMDADSFDSTTQVTSAANGTSGIESIAEITCTAIDSLAAGNRFRLRIARIAADATNDTMTGDAQLVAVEVRGVA